MAWSKCYPWRKNKLTSSMMCEVPGGRNKADRYVVCRVRKSGKGYSGYCMDSEKQTKSRFKQPTLAKAKTKASWLATTLRW